MTITYQVVYIYAINKVCAQGVLHDMNDDKQNVVAILALDHISCVDVRIV